ncbi:MAG: nucleotidyl transferase AbiEii/AbiGii toxin family protein [Betaproteobacteria bacterium]
MKKISERQRLLVIDLIAEEGLSISEYALEKDYIVTDALQAIFSLQHPQFDFVFCGGTCFSKAYGGLDRISEDVDIKVILKPGAVLSKSELRDALSKLKPTVISALVKAGFDEQDISKQASDENKYLVFDANYDTHFIKAKEMRSNMKLELNYTTLALAPQDQTIGLLLTGLSDGKPYTFQTKCVDLREGLIEKLISFPRRLAMHLVDSSRELDKTLVRHLFDVHQIIKAHPGVLDETQLLQNIFIGKLNQDAKDFANQHPEFLVDPMGELRKAMLFAKENPIISTMYINFIRDMVYSSNPPSFDEAFQTFNLNLEGLLPKGKLKFSAN